MDDHERAHHAQLLINNPLFQEALEAISLGINREMGKIKPNDKESAIGLVMMRQAADRISSYLITAAEGAKIAEFNAKQKRRRII